MSDIPHHYHRRSIRLKGYDYSKPGYYFITIVTHNRACLFGEIVMGEMRLNSNGVVAKKYWLEIPHHLSFVKMDEFIVMPNHIHGIISINPEKDVSTSHLVGVQHVEPLQAPFQRNQYQQIIPNSIGTIIRGFKSVVTKWFRANTSIYQVWQRNYYERIIRDENELMSVRQYVRDNPLKWEFDRENPAMQGEG